MKKEKQQKRPKRTKAQRVQALKTFAVDTVYDVVGSILFAIGVYTFAKSADFAPGGVSGLALICNYLWDLPIGTMTLIINIPIIIISYKVVGRKFLLKSFKTMVISTLFLDLVFPLTPLYTGNSFLAAIFSGVFMGAGLALIYMRGSSTGGCCFSKRMRKLFRKNEKSVLQFCNKSSKTKRAFTKVLMPCKRPF